MKTPEFPKFAVLVSANAEWTVVKSVLGGVPTGHSPYGEYFFQQVGHQRVLFFHGGFGKVAAAASTQYVIDHFHPAHLINIGTCGGVEGRIARFEVVVPDKLVIYDIYEAMLDATEAVSHYVTHLDVPANFPTPAVRTTLYSADRDLTPTILTEIEHLYQPTAVDWESGAIAWVAKRNGISVLIMRGVTDLVSLRNGEAEGNWDLFVHNTERVMPMLIEILPHWMDAVTFHSLNGA